MVSGTGWLSFKLPLPEVEPRQASWAEAASFEAGLSDVAVMLMVGCLSGPLLAGAPCALADAQDPIRWWQSLPAG